VIDMDAMQYGFAGFAFILLGIVVWMFKEVSKVVQENTKVITQFLDIVNEVRTSVNTNHTLLTTIHNILLGRRCVAEREN